MQSVFRRLLLLSALLVVCTTTLASETVTVFADELRKISADGYLSIEWNGMKLVGVIKRDQTDIDNLAKLNEVLADPNTDNQSDRFDKSIPIENELPYIESVERSSVEKYYVFIRGAPEGPGCSLTWYPRTHKFKNKILIKELTGIPWYGGFIDACTLNKYDLAGRVYKGNGASINLQIPKHYFDSNENLILGVSTPNKSAQSDALSRAAGF